MSEDQQRRVDDLEGDIRRSVVRSIPAASRARSAAGAGMQLTSTKVAGERSPEKVRT